MASQCANPAAPTHNLIFLIVTISEEGWEQYGSHPKFFLFLTKIIWSCHGNFVPLHQERNKIIKIMAKEEVTLRDKFTKWNVYRRVGKKLTESVETTSPMTIEEASKHFNASAISAVLN